MTGREWKKFQVDRIKIDFLSQLARIYGNCCIVVLCHHYIIFQIFHIHSLMLSQEVQGQLEKFKSTVEALQRNAGTLMSMLALPQTPAAAPPTPPQSSSDSSRTPVQSTLSHLERAQVLLALGQCMHALHQMHMKASGLDPQKHFERDVHKVRKNARLKAHQHPIYLVTLEEVLNFWFVRD